jgi:hypothetical protein
VVEAIEMVEEVKKVDEQIRDRKEPDRPLTTDNC